MELNEKWKLTTQNNAYFWEGNQISKQNRYPCELWNINHHPLFTSSSGVWTAAVTTYSANKLSASFQLLTKTSSNILQVN